MTARRPQNPTLLRRAPSAGWLGLGLLVLAVHCSTTDGAPVDPKSYLGAAACTADIDCGRGRHCGPEGACTLQCVTSKDCSFQLADPQRENDLECSLCGHCVAEGVHDAACLSLIDQPCASPTDCQALGANYRCSELGTCAPVCSTDEDCRNVGRGFGCGESGLCVRKCFRDADCFFHGWQYACELPAGVDPIENAESLTPTYGYCAPDPANLGFTDAGAGAPPAAAYQGVWGLILVSAVRVTGVPVLTTVDSASVQHLLVKATWSGGDVTFHEKWCALEIVNFREDDLPATNLFQIIVPDLNADSMLIHQNHALGVPLMVPGASFETDALLDIRGARLPNPETDPLPTYADLTNQWDQDRDGNPGMTAEATGLLAGRMYQAQRYKGVLKMVVVDADHLHGLAPAASEATSLGATVGALVNDAVTTQHPQFDRSYFRAARLANDASCVDVIDRGEVVGDWLAYAPHHDPSAVP